MSNWKKIEKDSDLPPANQKVHFFAPDWCEETCSGYVDENGDWVDSEREDYCIISKVTHWSPLLLPPTE